MRLNQILIKFEPGTGEWAHYQGELKDIHGWLFVLRTLFASSKEIQEIYKLEHDFERGHGIKQAAIME